MIFTFFGVSTFVSGVVALADGRPIGGLGDFMYSVFALSVIAQNRRWVPLRVSGLVESGALVVGGALLLTHVVLTGVVFMVFVPVGLVVAGGILGVWHWRLGDPDRRLPQEVIEPLRGSLGVRRVTLVLGDGRRVENVPVFAGHITSKAARRLVDPAEVIDVIVQPYGTRRPVGPGDGRERSKAST